MEKGEIRMIYVLPLLEKKPEGKAKLIKKLYGRSVDLLEYWTVQFISDGLKCDRFIKSE